MKFVRFENDGEVSYGVLDGKKIQVVEGDIFGNYKITNNQVEKKNVKLLAPCMPTKAVCVGLNYHDHAREMKLELPDHPLIFIKPPTCVSNPDGEVEYPEITRNLHFEAEMAVVIGKTARKVAQADALDYVFGYTCANDITARDVQISEVQWTRGKSCDSSLPLGPCIETEIDPDNIPVQLTLNGEVKQSSNTCNLIFKVPFLVEFISKSITLLPGDVILTGTSSGVGPMEIGDTVCVELGGIGSLCSTIVKG